MNELATKIPNTIELENLPDYDIQDYDVFDEKDFRKYINDVKRSIRNSLEYRQLIQFLKRNMNMNTSSFFENVNNIDFPKVKIEIHHSPYTLEDIVMTVFNKRVFYGEEIDIEDVAKEVMFIHYNLMVGLIPLTETEHELVHNQFLFIPTDKVIGNYKQFEEMYRNWIPEDTKDKVKAYEDKTLTYNMELDKVLLQQKQLPILVDGFTMYDLPAMQAIDNVMTQRLEELKNPNKYITDTTYDNNKPLVRGVTYDD